MSSEPIKEGIYTYKTERGETGKVSLSRINRPDGKLTPDWKIVYNQDWNPNTNKWPNYEVWDEASVVEAINTGVLIPAPTPVNAGRRRSRRSRRKTRARKSRRYRK